MARRMHNPASTEYEEFQSATPNVSRFLVFVSCVAALGAMIYGLWWPVPPATGTMDASLSTAPPTAMLASSAADQATTASADSSTVSAAATVPPIEPSPGIPLIGIVAGHWGNDQGAICPDGLTEVEINLDVAQRVVQILQDLGYQTELLEEYDPRLEGYHADALISIHADSCESYPNATPPASGFKVASVEDSLVPEAEERLVSCIAQCYAARTDMYFHANSITYDMRRYHSFYEIDGQTPGAIIETGFMYHDREMLTERADLVAQGIVEGIVCFIEGETP